MVIHIQFFQLTVDVFVALYVSSVEDINENFVLSQMWPLSIFSASSLKTN